MKSVSETHLINRDLTFTKRILGYLLLVGGFSFIAILIFISWEELESVLTTINWPLFAVSIVLFIAGNFVASIFFHDLLNKYSINTDYWLVSQLFFYGQIAKYIPGKIWSLFYQVASLRSPGGTSALVFSNVEIMVTTVIANIAIASSLLLLEVNITYSIGILFIGFLIYLPLAKSCLIYRTVGAVIAKMKLPNISSTSCSTKVKASRLALYYLANWIFLLGAFFIMLSATFNFSIEQSAIYLAYLYLAWIVSMFAFIVPAGLGVKEVVFIILVKFMSQDVSLDMLAAIAVISRFWNILQDLVGATLVFVLNRCIDKSV